MWIISTNRNNAPVNLDNITHVEPAAHNARSLGEVNIMILFHCVGGTRVTWKFGSEEERMNEWSRLMDKMTPKNKGGRPPKVKKPAEKTTETPSL